MAALSHYIGNAISSLQANPRAAVGAALGAGATYGGFTAMDYNKDNFMTDQENRFGRFTSARANMIAQVGQYRFDIRGLANVTVAKAHVMCDTAQLFMCVSAACTCAGRVGMHGSAPPGWLCALYTGSLFIGAMYLTICLWLGFHATLRAQCGMVSLLTRKVRLPIPSLAQINQSRQFGSGYEKQRWWDILRFPWVPHPFDPPEIPVASSDEDDDEDDETKEKKGMSKKSLERKAKRDAKGDSRLGDYAASDNFGSTGRGSVPSWIRDEQVVDKGNANVPHHVPQFKGDLQLHDSSDPHDAPDHFKLFMEAQKEWFPYETYHRIALLYGVCCFMHGVTYYCIIYAMSELRGFWIAWAIPGLFMASQYWILQLDIFKAHGQQFLAGFEWFGHIAPYFATAACTCEFRFMYSKAQVALAWAFAIAALASHMLFACRFFDLMTPDTMSKEMEDEDCKSWWPKSWSVPLAFVNTLWQITPPKKLKKGQHDLLHEAMNLERQHGGVCRVRRRRGQDSTKGHTKRATPQNPRALMNHVKELEDRFRNVWQNVIGKDQTTLGELYGRWATSREDAEALVGKTGDISSGTDSTGDEAYVSPNLTKAGEQKLVEVADELNHIEDALHSLGIAHQVTTETPGWRPGPQGVNLEQGGTSTRGLPQAPYWIMRLACATNIFLWAFMIVATGFEIVLGTEALGAPPGEPPWIRNMKLRPYQPDKGYLHLSSDPLPDWYRLFVAATMPDAGGHGAAAAGGHEAAAGGDHGAAPAAAHGAAPAAAHSPAAPAAHDAPAPADANAPAAAHAPADAHAPAAADHSAHGGRRLAEQQNFNDLFAALPALDWLAEKYLEEKEQGDNSLHTWAARTASAGLPTTMARDMLNAAETTAVPANGFMGHSLRALPVEWPPLFEPRHLACQTRATGAAIAALTSRGFGALLHISNSSEEKSMKAEQFSLAGISALGPLVGADWGSSGLHLVTKAGRLLHCSGHVPTDGAWACKPDEGTSVPMSPGATLRAAAVTEAVMGRTLALLFDNMPTVVVLYKEDVHKKSWLPAGEMHLPPHSQHASLSFNKNELIMVLQDGAVHHRPLDGAAPTLLAAPHSSVAREWHSTCATSAGEGGVVRLALRQTGPHAVVPELVVTAKMGTSSTPLVNV